MDYTTIRRFVPENAAKEIPPGNPACPVNGRDVYRALASHKTIVMACNIRIPLVIPGIMRAAKELDAVVAFELAKSEGDLKGGYTGMTPEIFVRTIVAAAKSGVRHPVRHPRRPHHRKNSSEAEVEGARARDRAELAAGYTSFAIDASFNEIPDNARITASLRVTSRSASSASRSRWGDQVGGDRGAPVDVEEAVDLMGG